MQLGGEAVYRFLDNEAAYVGLKYNSVSGQLNAGFKDANGDFVESSISRIEAVAGWYPINNLLVKMEYVSQTYTDIPSGIYKDGKFGGIVIGAVAAF